MEIKNTIQLLRDFVLAANSSRKYKDNTASGMRTVLKLLEGELNEEELASIDTLKKNAESIFQNIYSKSGGRYNAESINVYKKRLIELIGKYEQYGLDPQKIQLWNPKPRKLRVKKENSEIHDKPSFPEQRSGSVLLKLELPLRDERKAIIWLPNDLDVSEAKRINAIIAASAAEEKNQGEGV